MATEMLWVSLEERSRTNSPRQRFHSQLFCKIVRYFCRTLYYVSLTSHLGNICIQAVTHKQRCEIPKCLMVPTFGTVQLPNLYSRDSPLRYEQWKKETRRTTPGSFRVIILHPSHCSPSLRFNGQSITNLAVTKNNPDTTVEMWPSACWWMGLLPLLIKGTSLRVGRAAGNGSCPGSNNEVTTQLTAIGCSWGACWPLPVF